MQNGKEILYEVAERLTNSVDNPRHEARLLIIDVTGKDPRAFGFKDVTQQQRDRLNAMIERRLCAEPLQYILGEWEFMGIPIKLGKGVLCPRPDSECLVERCAQLLNVGNGFILDLCAGTGALALGLKKLLPSARIVAVEKYDLAYNYLKTNLATTDITAIKSDIADYYKQVEPNSVSLIISNPPYIPLAEKPFLSKELDFEPDTALFEPSYLYFYRLIVELYYDTLTSGGCMVFEVPTNKELDVANILKKKNFITEYITDYNHTIRGVLGIKCED